MREALTLQEHVRLLREPIATEENVERVLEGHNTVRIYLFQRRPFLLRSYL